MRLSRAWVNFKRMQDVTAAAALLIYAAAAIQAFQRLPGGLGLVARWTLAWPAAALAITTLAVLAAPVIRRWLSRHVWMSFRAGYGQSPISVLTGVGLLLGAAWLIWRQIGLIAETGRYGANIFSAYAAAIGVLLAQAVLVRSLERDPGVREVIEEP